MQNSPLVYYLGDPSAQKKVLIVGDSITRRASVSAWTGLVIGQFEHQGVSAHPNNTGMFAIAKAIFGQCKQKGEQSQKKEQRTKKAKKLIDNGEKNDLISGFVLMIIRA